MLSDEELLENARNYRDRLQVNLGPASPPQHWRDYHLVQAIVERLKELVKQKG